MKYIMLRIISVILRMHPLMTGNAMKLFWRDLVKEKRTSLKEKLWAYRKGFISGRIPDYGLTEDNYYEYLSDWSYFRLYPMNSSDYSAWIDDKLTTRHVLSQYKEYLPGYYFKICKGSPGPSVDQVGEGLEDLNRILEEKGVLAFKRESGSFGRGFYKVDWAGDGCRINGRDCSKEEFTKFVGSLDGYLVTEYIRPCSSIEAIYPGIANSLRLMVIREEDRPAYLANAFIRFGTTQSGGVDSAPMGVIASMLDLTCGGFDKGCQILAKEICPVEYHPDTGMRIKGVIPRWDAMVTKILEMTDYLSELSWLGFDVVVTEDSFRILEINSHQNIRTIQYFHPLLKNNPASDFLNGKLQEKGIRMDERREGRNGSQGSS